MNDHDVVQLLIRLVELDSVNPSLSAGGAGETQIVVFLEQWAHENLLETRRVEGTPGRPSLVITTPQRAEGRSLLLCGHVDTVGFGAMAKPLQARVESGRLSGRGAYDMKAGLAAALIAARDFARSGAAGRVVVAAVADEEHASLGIQEVLDGLDVDAAVVVEPTELMIAVAHRGFAWTRIDIVGTAAHGSRPELGIDAIMQAGPILVALNALDRRIREDVHARLGPGFLHASLIDGGTGESTIPDRCSITVERRTIPGQTQLDVERDIDGVLEEARVNDSSLSVSAVTTLAREPFEVDPESEIVRHLRSAADLSGAPSDIAAVSYWADSAFLAAAGIPTVLYGPIGDGAHADVEWVDLPSVITCAQVLTRLAEDFCGA